MFSGEISILSLVTCTNYDLIPPFGRQASPRVFAGEIRWENHSFHVHILSLTANLDLQSI